MFALPSVKDVNAKLNEVDSILYIIGIDINRAENNEHRTAEVTLANLYDYRKMITEYKERLENLEVPSYATGGIFASTVKSAAEAEKRINEQLVKEGAY